MSIAELSEDYLKSLVTRGQSTLTIRMRRSQLRGFLKHLERAGLAEPTDLRREHLDGFVEELTWEPTRLGVPMKVATRNGCVLAARQFVRWLHEHDFAAVDAGAQVAYAREPQPLPRGVPSEGEIAKVLAAPDAQTPLGFRDATMLELLYATGLRVRELVRLDVADLDFEHNFAFVRSGKGGKDRVVPIGKRAAARVQSYLAGVRPELVRGDEKALVLNCYGRRLSTEAVERLVRAYGEQAGVKHKLTPHLLRHACATHMMRRGASLRHVQELLGHADIATTELYTRLTQDELCQAHAKYHPREQGAESLR